MEVARMSYIVYYKGNGVLKRLEKMPVNIAYTSEKLNYTIFYGELRQEKNYFNQLKNIKGFLKLEQSSMFDEEVNFTLNRDSK